MSLVDMFEDDVDVKLLAKASARYDALDYDDCASPHVMKAYYQNLFPWKQLFLWLNQDHTPTRNFTHREFAFTLQNDAYLRYNSFANGDELKADVLRLNPARFEIGPIYSGRPKDKKVLNKSTFKPQLRELVFDVDMTDYDAVRQCCSDKKICKRCWGFIVLAAKVVDAILRTDFGFQHLLWVYSGRRGIHCWVSDRAALELQDDQRKAIVGWIDVIKGGAKQDKKVNLTRPLHPSLGMDEKWGTDRRSYNLLKDSFKPIVLQDQNCFGSAANAENLLKLFPEQGFATELRGKWKRNDFCDSSERKWQDASEASEEFMRQKVKSNKKLNAEVANAQAKGYLEDVVLQYTYPRIDSEVSKHLNHLLKSPFCVHPGTGRVCTPFASLKEIEEFDPEQVPTVGQLLRELEKANEGWKGTSLKPYIDIFERHCEAIVKSNLLRKKASNVKSMDF